MKQLITLITLFLLAKNIHAQKIVSDTICVKDTVLVSGNWTYPKDYHLPTEEQQGSFWATYCDYRRGWGFRLDFGFSQYYYSKSYADWLGYNFGANLNAMLAFRKLSVGIRFKPSTVSPRKELMFNNALLPKKADLDPIHHNYFIAYEFDLSNTLSIEPSIGYTTCRYEVINEETLKQQYTFNTTSGFLAGITVSKYLCWGNYKYAALFGRINHGFVDYSRIHSSLSGGYTEVCLGVSIKLYLRKRDFNVVEYTKRKK